MKKKNYDVQKCQQVEITKVCVPIQIFMFLRIAVILKIFNRPVLFLTLFNDNMCIGL